ncbi:MAG: hypothetical protein JJE55_16155 [Flavobacteriaceae bacterium]|nr:hypothetical protein [Flavobacteriaceae bacterium]
MRSEDLSFANLPFRSITLVLFMDMMVYLQFFPLKITLGYLGFEPLSMFDQSRYLSCCGGSIPLSPSKQDRIFLKDFLEFFGHYNISVEHVVFVAGRWKKYELSFMQKINQFLIFPHKN